MGSGPELSPGLAKTASLPETLRDCPPPVNHELSRDGALWPHVPDALLPGKQWKCTDFEPFLPLDSLLHPGFGSQHLGTLAPERKQ